jgi:hypothetical protein
MTTYRYQDFASMLQTADMNTGQDEGAWSNLVARARARARAVTYVVLEAAADHARFRVFEDDAGEATVDELLDGDHEYIHEAAGGSFSHPRHAHHTENVWKRNAELFASPVDRVVATGGIDFVIVTGDPHVVDLVSSALSSGSREVLATVAVDTVAPGASDQALVERIADEISTTREARVGLALDALVTQDSVRARTGVPAVVAELQEAAVATLLLDEEALAGQSLYATPESPWIAVIAESALPEIPAVDALVRAAILTGSELSFVAAGSLPDGAAVAAITRWAPDGQAATPTTATAPAPAPRADTVELEPPGDVPPTHHLTSHHRNTLAKILQHPAGHNIEWRDARALLDQAGIVEKADDGGIRVTMGGKTETIDRPHGKDLTVQDVVDLRRMLIAAGFDHR